MCFPPLTAVRKLKVGVFLLALLLLLSDAFYELISLGAFYIDASRLAFLLIFCSAFLAISVRGSLRSSHFDKLFLLLLVIIVIQFFSSFVGHDQLYSLKRWGNYAAFFLLPILWLFFVTSVSGVARAGYMVSIYHAVIVALVVSYSIALLQLLFPEFAYRPEVRELLGFRFQRINSYFVDPNFYACFLSVCISFLYAYRQTISKRSVACNCVITAGLIFIFLTGSRGGMLATVIALFFARVYAGSVKHRLWWGGGFLKKFFPLSCAILLPALVLGFAIFNFERNIELAKSYDDETLSSMSRVLTWYSGVQELKSSPLLGVGPGNYVELDKGRYLTGYVESWRAERISSLAAHSNILEITVESGIVAGLLYTVFFYICFKKIPSVTLAGLPFGIAILAFYLATITLSYYPYWMSFLIGVFLVHVKISES